MTASAVEPMCLQYLCDSGIRLDRICDCAVGDRRQLSELANNTLGGTTLAVSLPRDTEELPETDVVLVRPSRSCPPVAGRDLVLREILLDHRLEVSGGDSHPQIVGCIECL